jgi:hypothetical protein
MTQISKEQAIYELYRRGNLVYKLDPFQKTLHDQVLNSKDKIVVVLSSRRLGKSWLAATEAVMQCLRKSGSIVKILAPTKLMIGSILQPLFTEILKDAPKDFIPSHNQNKFIYKFANGSVIELAASNGGHAEKLRGSFADLIIVDEAGFCDDLGNTVRSILIPTTMNTRGKILLMSTPPKMPDHDFLKFVEDAELAGTLIKKTIYDNTRIKKEEIEEILVSYPGGAANPEFRREFLCEMHKDSSLAVIPEFTLELEKEVVQDWKRPPFYDAYEAMDLGFKDFTVILFAYYDFRASKIIIEDEIVKRGEEVKIPELAEAILAKETALWTNPISNEIKKPHLRVSDINYIVTQEIYRASNGKIAFTATKKDDKDAAINNLRVLLGSKKIIIHPRCQVLIRHLRNVKWPNSNNREKFGRSPDHGHYDAVSAAIYLCRNIEFNKNPYPPTYDYNKDNLMVWNKDKFARNNTALVFKNLFSKTNKKVTKLG